MVKQVRYLVVALVLAVSALFASNVTAHAVVEDSQLWRVDSITGSNSDEVDEPVVVYHTVIIDRNQPFTTPVELSVAHGQSVAQPANPSRSGFGFIGWYDGIESFDFDSPITEDIVIKAHWLARVVPNFAPGSRIYTNDYISFSYYTTLDAPLNATINFRMNTVNGWTAFEEFSTPFTLSTSDFSIVNAQGQTIVPIEAHVLFNGVRVNGFMGIANNNAHGMTLLLTEYEPALPPPVRFIASNPRNLLDMLVYDDVVLATSGNLGIFSQHSPFVIPAGRTLYVESTLNIQGNAELIIEGNVVVLEGGRINNQGGLGGTITIAESGRLTNYGHVENVTNSAINNHGTIINNSRFEVRAGVTFNSTGYVKGATPLNIHRNAIIID